MEEISVSISLVRPFPPCGLFEGVRDQSAIESRFRAEEACLAQMVVVGQVTEGISTARSTYEGEHRIVRNVLASLDLTRAVGYLLRKPTIARYQRPGESCKRKKCFQRAGLLQFPGAGPELFLIFCHVFHKRQEQFVVRISARLQKSGRLIGF